LRLLREESLECGQTAAALGPSLPVPGEALGRTVAPRVQTPYQPLVLMQLLFGHSSDCPQHRSTQILKIYFYFKIWHKLLLIIAKCLVISQQKNV
jgi:hypothetical protein